MSVVQSTVSGNVAVLTLNRPQVLNAIDQSTVDSLNTALDAIETSDAQAVVITGNGRAFSAGADVKAADNPIRRQQSMYDLAIRLAEFSRPTVAAVNGIALGGGLELALYCTFRIGAPGATFGFPEIHRAVMPGFGGTQLLPRLVGVENALRLLMTGDPIGADEALRIGLLSEVASDALDAAVSLARRCARSSELAQRAIMEAVIKGRRLPLEDALALESQLVGVLAKQPEAASGREALQARIGSSNGGGVRPDLTGNVAAPST